MSDRDELITEFILENRLDHVVDAVARYYMSKSRDSGGALELTTELDEMFNAYDGDHERFPCNECDFCLGGRAG